MFSLHLRFWLTLYYEVRAVAIEDKNSAVETVSREKATSDPGSVGAPMSGVVVEVRVKEGQEILKGDPVCGECVNSIDWVTCLMPCDSLSTKCHEGKLFFHRVGVLVVKFCSTDGVCGYCAGIWACQTRCCTRR
jgi:hypothetical protein